MHSFSKRKEALAVVVASVAYVTIGVVTAVLARNAPSPAATTGWRLVALGLSVAVFVTHVTVSRRGNRRSPSVAAWLVALSVAVSAFILAAAGPVRSHWSEPDFTRGAGLSLILWPPLTGLPAFGVAFAMIHLLDWRARRGAGS